MIIRSLLLSMAVVFSVSPALGHHQDENGSTVLPVAASDQKSDTAETEGDLK